MKRTGVPVYFSDAPALKNLTDKQLGRVIRHLLKGSHTPSADFDADEHAAFMRIAIHGGLFDE